MTNIFDFKNITLEKVACNCCRSDHYTAISNYEYGLRPMRICLCLNCGLIYINPRMSKDDYDLYYKEYYREDRQLLKKGRRGGSLDQNFEAACLFGKAFSGQFKNFLKAGLVVDVGSSTGGVLAGFKESIPGLEVLGIEPSKEEAGFANQRGIKTLNTLFENLNHEFRGLSAVICVQSLNHLLDPRSFFEWSYNILKEDGLLILSVKNFRHQVFRAGSLSGAVQVDHPYMFVSETLRLFVESVGFEIVYFDHDEFKSLSELLHQKEQGLTTQHIRLTAKKSPSKKVDPKKIHAPLLARQIGWQLSPWYIGYKKLRYRLKF